MKTKKKIYYAHSRDSFNTAKENRELKYLKAYFPGYSIFCPNHDVDDIDDFKEALLYNPIIDTCSILVVAESKGFIDRGEFIAVTRAFSNKMPVYGLNSKVYENYLFEVSGVEIINDRDWIYDYAKLTKSNWP